MEVISNDWTEKTFLKMLDASVPIPSYVEIPRDFYIFEEMDFADFSNL